MIDEQLYSRQLYVIGNDAMRKINCASVLIYGMSGVSVEIAKNVVLGGIKKLGLYDVNCVQNNDLLVNFYLNESNLGKNKIDCIREKISQLNPYVVIENENNNGTIENIIVKYDVLVVCNETLINMIHLNNLCRKNNIKFISANTIGHFGNIFCDFGDNFTVYDTDGEEEKNGIVVKMENNNITTSETHQLYVGDVINIIMNDKNIDNIKILKVLDAFTFTTDYDFGKYDYVVDVKFLQVKQKETINFKNLENSILDPQFANIISEDVEKQKKLHEFNIKFDMFVNIKNKLPDENDVNFFGKDNDDMIKLLSMLKKKLPPLDYIIGSISSQEVIKAISGKFTPINQWLYIDYACIDNLDEFKDKIKEQQIFIIGAGAIGCELLKNLAMIGIKNITITDMDTIEKSNLNRQFLFRNNDIGKYKSDCAKDAILKIKPDMNIVAQKFKIGSETTQIYNSDFFKNKIVLTALDNVQTRMYVDNLCVENKIPMIDSGTLGTKGNVQIVYPYMTETYSSSVDPPEKSIPVCTIKSYPYLIDHTIQWARELFEGWFNKAPQNYMKFKNDKNFVENIKLDSSQYAEIIKDVKFILDNKIKNNKDCILFAYKMFHEQFRDLILNLTKDCPKNKLTDEGIPFWSGTKKYPSEIILDLTNEMHIGFIEATANLWADVHKVNHIDKNDIMCVLKNLAKPEFREKNKDEKDNDNKININIDELNFNIDVLTFEKDCDSNFHIDFITHTSNLRATNYKIQTIDRLKTKGIAGKIIPAIATTTSLVSSLVVIELLKIIMNKTKNFNNTFINLATSFMGFSEPIIAKKTKIGIYEFSLWDELIYNDQPIKNIMEDLKQKFNCDISITLGEFNLINNLMSKKTLDNRMCKNVKQLYKEICKQDNEPKHLILSVIVDIDDDNSEIVSCKIVL